MRARRGAAVAALVLVGYDTFVRPRILDWGATREERYEQLPGDDVVDDVMTHHTRAVTIDATPEDVWPWLVQIGDRRGGFYSYDWIERLTGTVHYVEGRHSATRIHPELQDIQIGDRIATGSIGDNFRIDAPITVVEPNHALVIGTWAFVLTRRDDGTTRFLVRDRDTGWLRRAVPRRSGLMRMIGGAVDYLVGEPLHFAMVRKMMLGTKARAEHAACTEAR